MNLRISKANRTRLAIAAVIILVVVGGFVWWRLYAYRTPAVQTYDACVKAGNPVEQSFPSVCIDKDGQRFPNPSEHVIMPTTN